MELYLQIGHGMMGISQELTKRWGKGTAILSPRDLNRDQMLRFAKTLASNGATVVFDPQFYLPRADHERLTSHSYWPHDYETATFDRDSVRALLNGLLDDYIAPIGARIFITPGRYASEIDTLWMDISALIAREAIDLRAGVPVYQSVCISDSVLRSEESVHTILEYLEPSPIDGVYLVAEPPQNMYLVDDPLWILNLLDLCAGLTLQGKQVIVGYSNHQDLLLALCGVEAIASGTYLNVRRFPRGKFLATESDEISRRTTWYYCPQALSEYQIPFLDIAKRGRVLDQLRTDASFGSQYAATLFDGAQPSSVEFGERHAFAHYLQCLSVQVAGISRGSYDETRNALRLTYETAAEMTEVLQRNGVRGKIRDFGNVVDSTLAALDQFDLMRGMVLRQCWNDIGPKNGDRAH